MNVSLNNLAISLNIIVLQTQLNLPVLGTICGILLASFILTRFFIPHLLLLGIIPRHLKGLPGIICAPFLHAHFDHLFFNLIPLLALSDFILINGLMLYVFVTACITILSGAAIWLFAKPGIHIGASALITGYWGFLVSSIYNQGTLTTIILGLISLYYFAGIFLGIFPAQKGVSWEGHLFGLLAGVATSILLIM